MAKNPMSISTFIKVGKNLPEWASVLLRADHGLGKSMVVRELGGIIKDMMKFDEMPVIDRRLSQMSEGDMIGLPSTDGECTRFNPPDWYKRACAGPCVLFLDELNRATPEVMQAAFQIVLDRELNGHKLHPQTRVYAAINTGGSYTVNEMDPALLDRFFVVDLCPDVKDWLDWAQRDNIKKKGGFNVNPVISEFIRTDQKWLDIPTKNIDHNDVHPSRRSWERVSDALEHAGIVENPDDALFYPVVMGFVGTEASIAFRSFAKNFDNRINGKDILDKYHTKGVKQKVKRQGQEGLNACIDKLALHVSKHVEKLTKKQGENLRDFMEELPGELRISCWGKLTSDGIEKMELAKSIHFYCAESMLKVFGVPMGEAGIGVVPNIPGIFQQDKDKK